MASKKTGSDLKSDYYEFWRRFKHYSDRHFPDLGIRNPRRQNSSECSIGRANTYFRFSIKPKDCKLKCELIMRECEGQDDALEIYPVLKKNEGRIKSTLNLSEPVKFEPKQDDGKARISVTHHLDFHDESQWQDAIAWLADTANKFRVVLPDYWRGI